MPEGGTLTLAARSVTLASEEGQALGLHAGRYVVVEVAGTGAGMAAETVGRQFFPVAESL